MISYRGRVGSQSAETLGVTTLAGGVSALMATPSGASGLATVGYSSVLTLTDLVRSSSDAMLIVRDAPGVWVITPTASWSPPVSPILASSIISSVVGRT